MQKHVSEVCGLKAAFCNFLYHLGSLLIKFYLIKKKICRINLTQASANASVKLNLVRDQYAFSLIACQERLADQLYSHSVSHITFKHEI